MPSCVVNQVVDPGLIQVIEQAMVPQLEQPLPRRIEQAQLDADPLRHRCMQVTDREGYSPDYCGACERSALLA